MSRVSLVPTLLVVFCSGLPSVATAQERFGFWAGFDVSVAGSGDITADNVAGTLSGSGRDKAGEANISLGWTIRPQWLVGVETNAWGKTSQGELAIYFVSASGTVQYYPKRSSAFFVKGGAGVSTVDFDIETPDTHRSVQVGSGFGMMAGAGYDIRLGRGFWVVPAVNFRYGRPGDIVLYGETQFRNWRQNMIDVTVGVAFHRTR